MIGGRSMGDCLTHLSKTKLWHDVTFSFKNDCGKLLYGHRLILSLRSPVFEAMFFGSLADNQDTVDIADIEHAIFDHILRYIYTDKTNLNGDNVLPILYGATKYCLTELVKECSSFLVNSLFCDNVCTIYEHAKMFNMDALVQTCFVFMSDHSSAVSLSKSSTCLSHESLTAFLSSECLSGRELDHFRLANNWAEQKCKSKDMEPTPENKRVVLGEIVTKINYTLMKPEDFSEVVVPTDILLAEDQIRLFQYMITGNKTHIDKYIFPSRNHPIIIDTSRLEGKASEADKFVFTFRCSENVKLMKIFPLTVKGLNKFGRNNAAKITVSKGDNIITNVPIDTLDELGSLTNGLDIPFLANTKYTVCIIVDIERHSYDRRHGRNMVNIPSISTLNLSHTTKVGSVSFTIEQIPRCVETVEFKVGN